jgi:membrane carboxypeptidase/penicillin-binding protein PbpC
MDKNGKIKSMNVCRKPFSEDESWINTCLIKRQTGSAIKPFVYLLAMNQL